MKANGANRLKNEKSPYLLQHADNPVDWYPWCEDAFVRARREDRPIFLSIGYSSCHWCHVMERESFSDPGVAALMNRAFVSIKVDREERPDIDGLYMKVCQIITGSGGWPLTIIMTPDKKPFFAATYLPRQTRFGLTGMTDLVPRIEEIWKGRRDEVEKSATEVLSTAASVYRKKEKTDLEGDIDEKAFTALAGLYDAAHGGFGTRPKFPNPLYLLYLLRYWSRTGSEDAAEMVRETLKKMRRGGIYDHVGGGFHRYSVDAQWRVPHFEKMLYDQALLALAYAYAYQAFGDSGFMDTCRAILDFVLREFSDPGGGFYTALDADTEGVEGKYYLWRLDEVREVLGNDMEFFSEIFSLSDTGNLPEGEAQAGMNILYLADDAAAIAEKMKLPEEQFSRRMQSCLARLHERRSARTGPFRDEKILTDWNGLMIAALAAAGRIFGEERFVAAAEKAAGFIIGHMIDGVHMKHRFVDCEAAIGGFIDDYSFFAWGLIELYETTFIEKYLSMAIDLTREMMRRFGSSGLFYLSADSKDLQVPQNEIYDGVIPAGNSVAVMNLLRLARMAAIPEFEERARSNLDELAGSMNEYPLAHLHAVEAAGFARSSAEVVISGVRGSDDTGALLCACNTVYAPDTLFVFRSGGGGDGLIDVPISPGGGASASVCRNFTCGKPVHDPAELAGMLKNIRRGYDAGN